MKFFLLDSTIRNGGVLCMQRKRGAFEYLGILVFCSICLVATISRAYSDELENIGLRAMPSALKQRFPVCDKQLIVNWINPAKGQGYSEYDTYNRDGKHIERFKAFVNLSGASLTYKLLAYYPREKGDGRKRLSQRRHQKDSDYSYFPEPQRLVGDNFDELHALVKREGLFHFSPDLYSEAQSKTVSQILTGIDSLTLSNNTTTVCVAFPDEKTVWLAERKAIRYTHKKEQVDALYERLKELFFQRMLAANPGMHREIFESISSHDLNNDGVDDYYFDFKAILSVKKRDGRIGYQDISFFDCATTHYMHRDGQITTDGKEFFFDDCNISRAYK